MAKKWTDSIAVSINEDEFSPDQIDAELERRRLKFIRSIPGIRIKQVLKDRYLDIKNVETVYTVKVVYEIGDGHA